VYLLTEFARRAQHLDRLPVTSSKVIRVGNVVLGLRYSQRHPPFSGDHRARSYVESAFSYSFNVIKQTAALCSAAMMPSLSRTGRRRE